MAKSVYQANWGISIGYRSVKGSHLTHSRLWDKDLLLTLPLSDQVGEAATPRLVSMPLHECRLRVRQPNFP
jgi:hypothetical protein